jgi:cytoskeletal protein RodZ
MPALGDEFRSAREARGLSLSDVAERLHIRSVYLAAIEDEDWSAIGPPVYIRGFMRTYARFLGLDAEELVARFSAGSPTTAVAAARPDERARAAREGGERSRPSLVAIIALVVAAAVVAYVGYAYLAQGKPASAPVALASPDAETAVAPASVADLPPTPTPQPRPSHAAAKRGLSVHLTETSWLRVTIDGTVALEGTFPAGTAKRFEGKDADVRVGNAGGVELTANGRAVGPLGAPGEVAERHFTLSGE